MIPVSFTLPRQDRPLVEMIYFDAGGGHRASATALKTVAEEQRRPWRISMTNLRDVLEPVDFIRRLTGIRAEDFYNTILKLDLTAGVGAMLPIMHMLIRRMHTQNTALLARHWAEPRPDLVVSLIPHFNRTIFDGLRMADAACGDDATPMVTIMTDLADSPPYFWIERQDYFLICGTSRAVRQAIATGVDSRLVLRASGMIVRPEFYLQPKMSRADERWRLGLQPELPTALVMFGGYGSRRMITIARRLAESAHNLQVIFLCGHNQRLREHLAAMKLPFPCHVEGFTREVPYFMRLSDFFIGKPGPGSISEALVMGLPVIVERNASTTVQERYNCDWILANRLGVVIRGFGEISNAIAMMLDAAQIRNFRERISTLNNRAVFEIPDMLAEVMEMWHEPGWRAVHARA